MCVTCAMRILVVQYDFWSQRCLAALLEKQDSLSPSSKVKDILLCHPPYIYKIFILKLKSLVNLYYQKVR